ncbi:MAG: hypothetical protein FWF43_00775, partial [Propionibacteriaceae bacterium]|nr:hypothetical protein [Propionibacteriaceae bacterium]
MTVTTSSDLSEIIGELKRALGEEYVLTDYHQRAIRTFSAAPMGVHLWKDLLPDVVVMPASTAEVVA